jgi:hypothetical protein
VYRIQPLLLLLLMMMMMIIMFRHYNMGKVW